MSSRGPLGVGVALAVVVIAGVLTAGCGSSDKPSYCSATSDLQSDVNQVGKDITTANFSAVQSDIDTVKSQATTVVADAKSDFPSETDAVDSAVNDLVDSVNSLGASPSGSDLLSLGAQAATAVNAVKDLSSAVGSKC
jgi:outer membrane murein-binding lipoprotein Lpp